MPILQKTGDKKFSTKMKKNEKKAKINAIFFLFKGCFK